MRYENAANRADERAVADAVAAAWECRLSRLPPLASVDYYAERNDRLVALVEIKCRAKSWSEYPVVWIDAHKLLVMLEAAYGWSTQAVFVVRCRTDIVWCNLAKLDGLTTLIGGRDDRDDPNDRDLIVCIPKHHFRALA